MNRPGCGRHFGHIEHTDGSRVPAGSAEALLGQALRRATIRIRMAVGFGVKFSIDAAGFFSHNPGSAVIVTLIVPVASAITRSVLESKAMSARSSS
jgi:hypothetical protein